MDTDIVTNQTSRQFPRPVPMKTHSPDTKPTRINKTISPSLIIKNSYRDNLASTIGKSRNNAEIEALRLENDSLRGQLRLHLQENQYEEVERLKSRLIEQYRIIMGFRMEKTIPRDLNKSYSEDKDRLIKELRHVLSNMLEAGSHQNAENPDVTQLKQTVKALTAENIRLGYLVHRLHDKEDMDLYHDLKLLQSKIDSLQHENFSLNNTIRTLETKGKPEIEQIRDENMQLSQYNSKLLKLLKYNDTKYYEEEISRLQNELKSFKYRPYKLTLTKIKEQYAENLKFYQQHINTEVQREFYRYYTILNAMNEKLNIFYRHFYRYQSEHNSPIVSRFNPADSNRRKFTFNNMGDEYFHVKIIKTVDVEYHDKIIHTETRTYARIAETVDRSHYQIDHLRQEIHRKSELLSHQYLRFQQLQKELYSCRDSSLHAIENQIQSLNSQHRQEIEKLNEKHRYELVEQRAVKYSELAHMEQSYSLTARILEQKIREKYTFIEKLQVEIEKLKMSSTYKSYFKRTETETLQNTQSNHGFGLHRVTYVMSYTDSHPGSKINFMTEQTYNLHYRSELRKSIEYFKNIIDNLMVENNMIPYLRGRIKLLESYLLRVYESYEMLQRRVGHLYQKC